MSGIEITDTTCGAHGRVRLHWNDFGGKTDEPVRKWYADTEDWNGPVSEWKSTPEDAVNEILSGPGNSASETRADTCPTDCQQAYN